ncbi:MAG TPA: HAMP domain-containing protein [Terriglobia bacterium]|nr:HAMP domain-containing protein [Terriglobia bacterium]
MRLEVRKPFHVFQRPLRVFARGASLRRRVIYSLAIVRLILVPVIVLAIWYLFAMARIVDQIVGVDAPVANMAERASIEMLNARRTERNYFLLHDADDLQANRHSLAELRDLTHRISDLQPEEQTATQAMLDQLNLYQNRLEVVVSHLGEPGPAPLLQIQTVVRAYEKDIDDLLRRARRQSESTLIDELRTRVGSFDAQITETLESTDPSLRQTSLGLQDASSRFVGLASDLQQRSWSRVENDHREARQLKRRAEWVLLIVSTLVFLLSVWVSFVLPREVVSPLVDLKAAVDHAAAGNYEIEFDVQGEGEVVQLANSVRRLIAHVREKELNGKLAAKS